MKFGEALAELKEGKMIARHGWNGKTLFVFRQIPSIVDKSLVPKMQSLPDLVKKEFEKRFNDPNEQIDAIYYDNQLAIVNSSNLICGWTPSVSDSLAEDWFIYQ